jgi:hypothetical protein
MEIKSFIIPALKNAISTVAKAWIPMVLEKISIIKPKTKPKIRVIQRGNFTGNDKIKRI